MTRRISIQWVGDVALIGRYLSPRFRPELSDLVHRLSDQVEPTDLRLVNWEAPLLGVEGLHPTKNFVFHTDEGTARALLPFRIDVALLANNHAVDCMQTGLDKTITFLNDVGIATVGAGRTATEAQQPLHLMIREVPITILNYVDEITIPTIPDVPGAYLNSLDPDRVIDEVITWSGKDRVVLVNFHWGIEFAPCPTPEHRAFARRVIEAGASVVSGHHPHRLQGHEQWKEGHIFYSLGNFLFGLSRPRSPWLRISWPTAIGMCEIEDRRVVKVSLQHFTLRNCLLEVGDQRRSEKLERRLNRLLELSKIQYERYWSRVLTYLHFIVWPTLFIRRKGWKGLFRLRWVHCRSYVMLVARYFGYRDA